MEEKTSVPQTGATKTIIKEVFGEMLSTSFLIKAAVNFVKAFLQSFFMTLSGHMIYYVSEKLSPSIAAPNYMPNATSSVNTNKAFGGYQQQSTQTMSTPASSSPYPVLTSPRGDERFPGFIR